MPEIGARGRYSRGYKNLINYLKLVHKFPSNGKYLYGRSYILLEFLSLTLVHRQHITHPPTCGGHEGAFCHSMCTREWKIDYTLNFSTRVKDKYKRDMFVIILLLIYSPLVFTLFQYRFCMFILAYIHKIRTDIYFMEVTTDDGHSPRKRNVKNQFNVYGLKCIQL